MIMSAKASMITVTSHGLLFILSPAMIVDLLQLLHHLLWDFHFQMQTKAKMSAYTQYESILHGSGTGLTGIYQP